DAPTTEEEGNGEQTGPVTDGPQGGLDAPGGGGPPPVDGGPPSPPGDPSGTGRDDLDDYLDTCAPEETVVQLTEQATPWYDHPIAKGAENLVEGLIPGYGMYDAVRDNWNRQGDMVEMAPP